MKCYYLVYWIFASIYLAVKQEIIDNIIDLFLTFPVSSKEVLTQKEWKNRE